MGQRARPQRHGNRAFDAELRQRNPAWGLRQLDDVVRAARDAGLDLVQRIGMPANNLVLRFRRKPAPAAG